MPSPSSAVVIRFHAGAHAHDTNDCIIYNPNTGALLYDLEWECRRA